MCGAHRPAAVQQDFPSRQGTPCKSLDGGPGSHGVTQGHTGSHGSAMEAPGSSEVVTGVCDGGPRVTRRHTGSHGSVMEARGHTPSHGVTQHHRGLPWRPRGQRRSQGSVMEALGSHRVTWRVDSPVPAAPSACRSQGSQEAHFRCNKVIQQTPSQGPKSGALTQKPNLRSLSVPTAEWGLPAAAHTQQVMRVQSR